MVPIVVLLAATGCGSPSAPDSDPDPSSPGTPSSSTQEASPYVEVGDGPVGLATGGGSVWSVTAQGQQLVRIDAESAEADDPYEAGSTPLRTTYAAGSVWVTSFGDGKVLRIDPDHGTVLDSFRVGEGPEGITGAFGSIWVVAQDSGQLVRIDPSSPARVIDRLDIGDGARLVTASQDAVYVAQFDEDRVLKVDPDSGRVTRSAKLCSGPQGMAVGQGRLWVACTFADKVVAIDLDSLEKVAQVDVPGSPDPVAIAPSGEVLVAAEDGPTLVTIDPDSTEVTERTTLGDDPALSDAANIDLVVTAGQAWVSAFRSGRVYHVPVGD
jgi:DNA-binding beta-propeller fold protein YncE